MDLRLSSQHQPSSNILPIHSSPSSPTVSTPAPLSPLPPSTAHSSAIQSLSSLPEHCSSNPTASVSVLQPLQPPLPSDLASNLSTPKSRNKAPLLSSTRFCPTVVRRSSLSTTTTTTTTDFEHGFTPDEDLDRAPLLSELTLQSLAGAPMPTLHEFLGQQLSLQPSDRSSPSRVDHPHHSPDLHVEHLTPTHDHHSSSSRLSRPSKLSDENLQRQSTGIKERVKRSIKMRETERWARQTASNSHQTSSPPLQPSSSSSSPVTPPGPTQHVPSDTPTATLPLLPSSSQVNSYTHACPSPETLPRPRLSVQPVPSFRAIPSTEPATDCVIPSEHATVHDWQSENTNVTHLLPPSQHPDRPIFPLSPIDVQFIGQTPTALDFQSFNQLFSSTILPGTVIASNDEHNKTMANSPAIPISFSPFPPPFSQQTSQPSPRIEEIPPTPPSQPSKEQSDSLLQARFNLQHALSTTPLARSSPNQNPSPSTSPVAHRTLQHAISINDKPIPEEENTLHDDDDGDYDDDQDNESGLSPIKEDRTAELAAEHSWRIKFMAGPSNPSHHLSNLSTNQLRSSVSVHLLDPVRNAEAQPLSLSHPHRSRSDGSIVSVDLQKEHQALNNDKSTLTNPESGTTIDPPAQFDNSHDPAGGSPKDLAHKTSDNEAFEVKREQINSRPRSQSPKETHSDPIPISSPQPTTSSPPQTVRSVAPTTPESSSSRRHASPMCGRPGPHQRPNPPLSVPASARRPPPEDLLSRLEMEEWRNQTGIDDRYSLSLRPANFSSSFAAAGGAFPANNALDFDRTGVVGLGAEERRGIKDRWGNSWGLESHILSPLSEHTELTTVGSILSLSTRKSNHSLRSIDSTGNSIAQRLDQADSHSIRMMKLGANLIPGGAVRSTQTNAANRTASCPINRIDSPNKLTPHAESSSSQSLLLEEKMKRREERRLKREKREKRRAHEIQSSESLAQKQERRRQEKKRKEEFMEKKHQILQKIQETGDNAQLVRDLGILYMTSNAGVVGLKLAIRHLEISLQMDDSDPVAWSCLGKTWTHLYGTPETETTKINDLQEATKSQQAHNATIGLRKAIIHSRTYHEVIKYKIEWARFLETIGRWRDSLGLISELLKTLGKSEFKCWANLGFTALRIVFGWPPLSNLEADDLEQGFTDEQVEAGIPSDLFESKNRPENLTDSDRSKLLAQVHNAFERALALIDEQIVSSHLTHVNNVHGGSRPNCHNNHASEVASVDQLKAYKSHYRSQLHHVKTIQKKLKEEDNHLISAPPRLTRDHAPHTSLSSTEELDPDTNQIKLQVGRHATTPSISKDDDNDLVTEEVHECNSISLRSHSSSPCPTVPTFHDPREVAPHAHHTDHLDASNCLGISTSTSEIDQPKTVPVANHGSLASVTPKGDQLETKLEAWTSFVTAASNQLQQPDELPNLSTARQFPLSDENVSSSDGPEVIVQYDDVDTTNDYSERSKNSDDPFRPASHLGHHHYLIGQPSLTTHPIHDRPHSARGHLPSNLRHSIEDSKLSAADEQLDHRHNPPIVDLPPPSSDEKENLGSALSASPRMRADSLHHSTVGSCAGLANEAQPETRISHPRDPKSQHILSNQVEQVEAEVDHEEEEEETGARDRNNKTPDEPLSSNVLRASEVSLDHKICKMGFSSPVQRRLRGLDKEKLIAFLELDSDYHSQVTQLRKKLNKIEEERETKRKEMFEKLGIQEIYSDQIAREENLTDREEAEEGSVRRSGPRLEEESQEIRKGETNEEEEEGIREGDSRFSAMEKKQDQRRRLGSSFGSIRSTNSLPTGPRLSQHLQQHQLPTPHHHKEFIPNPGRSVWSPTHRHDRNNRSLRGRAFSFNGVGTEPLDPTSLLSHHHHGTTNPADISCNSTAVNDIGHHSPIAPPPGSSDSNQANIALQGIAAILKLATSTQSN